MLISNPEATNHLKIPVYHWKDEQRFFNTKEPYIVIGIPTSKKPLLWNKTGWIELNLDIELDKNGNLI